MSSGYIALSRQSGLMMELQSVANNVANMSTTGYRKEGLLFSEVIQASSGSSDSVSMGAARIRLTDDAQGPLKETGGTFDFAIDGPGFFLLETLDGQRLTRAGVFSTNGNGELVSPDGYRLLDAGGAPIFVPPDVRGVSLSSDGTLSADGNPIAQIGLWEPIDINDLRRQTGVMFEAPEGVQAAAPGATLLQGFVEGSNVNPLQEMSRMVEVQRAYELTQSFRDNEGKRASKMIETLGKQ